MSSFRTFSLSSLVAVLVLTGAAVPDAQNQPSPITARSTLFNEADLRNWLTNLSSDQMQGRAVFTEGYGLASAYIAGELRALGVKPMGDNGSYFQSLTKTTYNVERKSALSITIDDETRVFAQGDHATFSMDTGAKQVLKFSGIEFIGDGPPVDGAVVKRLGRDVSGKLVVYMPNLPAAPGGRGRPRGATVTARSNFLIETEHAAAVIALAPQVGASTGRSTGAGTARTPTLTTVLPLDGKKAPALTGDETLFAFLLKQAPIPFGELQAKSKDGEALPMFSLPAASVSIDVNSSYEPATIQFTQNVVGMVEGTDPRLKNTYVFFGAHLDHVGYSTGLELKGRVNTPIEQDRIWNGADDDGSGSTALLALAKAFMTGPKPKRSVIFVWHAGEEAGLLGSQFMAGHPVVPLESIQVELNIDMIGRNRNDDPKQADTLYLIGADRISTDLHNLLVDVNERQRQPLTLDYEFNDASDPNRFYERSDHFSYASKGIPITFFFTGEHPDYHANTDTVDKILFPKMIRVVELVYAAGFKIANSDAVLVRDNRGPRSGRGFSGRLN